MSGTSPGANGSSSQKPRNPQNAGALQGAIDYPPRVLRSSPKWLLPAGVLLVLILSFVSRYAQGRDHALAGQAGWITTDADSHYHMRRVQRALSDGLHVAERDPYLNYPQGSAIPWPPYYTFIVSAVLAPFAPSEALARQAFIEERVASLPILFGVLTSLLAGLAGALVAGRRGALFAGSYHALCHISIAYSNLGNGDHHAFVSFMSAALLLCVSWVLCKRRLDDSRLALAGGTLAGVLLGVLLGSWLGSMVLLIAIELVLAWMFLRQGRRPLAGLASFGLSLHLVAGLVLLPAVLSSPWTELEPWMLVNLSYFHLAFLGLGALVFVPLFWLRRQPRALARYPWIVGALLVALGLGITFVDTPLSTSVREGFAWASKANRFMAGIVESRSLFAGEGSPGPSFELGYGFWLLPLALISALYAAWRRAALELLPWISFAALACLQASQQARFAESLALPLAVLLGWFTSRCLQAKPLGRLPRPALMPLVLILVLFSHGASTATTVQRLRAGRPSAQASETPATLARRLAANWMARNTPSCGDYAVLAEWSAGHTLEWAADRPTVATNFGSYVGQDGFRAPALFFMEEDPVRAEALLVQHKARYVLVSSELPDQLNSLIERAAPLERERWIKRGSQGQVALPWFRTMGARLMFDGTVFQGEPAPQLDFLRLCYLSPIADPGRPLRGPRDLCPAALLWERVEGARVECAGEPGETLRIEIELRYPAAQRSVQWKASAQANAHGRALLRVPYATLEANGAGQVVHATWHMGPDSGSLAIGEYAVQGGSRVSIQRQP